MDKENSENYIKDFDGWNIKKKLINERILPDSFFFLDREIWWASLGVNIGREIDGKNMQFERPILILKKFNHETMLALPMTTIKNEIINLHTISYKGGENHIILNQARFLSINRLLRLVFRIKENEFNVVKSKFVEIINKNETPYF